MSQTEHKGRCRAASRHGRGRTVIAIAAPLIVAVIASGCSSEPEWAVYEGQSGDYSIEMPGDPVLDTTAVPTAAGNIDLSIATVEVDNAAFAATEADLPPGTPFDLNGSAEGAVASSIGGSVNSTSALDVDGVPCLRFDAAGEREGQHVELEGVVCHADDRYYQLVFVHGGDEPEDADRFLDSLSFSS